MRGPSMDYARRRVMMSSRPPKEPSELTKRLLPALAPTRVEMRAALTQRSARPVPILFRRMQESASLTSSSDVAPYFFKDNIRTYTDKSTNTSLRLTKAPFRYGMGDIKTIRRTLYDEGDSDMSWNSWEMDRFFKNQTTRHRSASPPIRSPKAVRWPDVAGDWWGGNRRHSPAPEFSRTPSGTLYEGSCTRTYRPSRCLRSRVCTDYPKNYIPYAHAPASRFHEGCRFCEIQQSRGRSKAFDTYSRTRSYSPTVYYSSIRNCSYGRDPWLQKEVPKPKFTESQRLSRCIAPPLRTPRLPKKVLTSKIIDPDLFQLSV